MLTDARTRRIATGSAGLAVVALAATAAAIASYEPANDGGTSMTGVAFGIGLFVGAVSLTAPALLGAHLRWSGPAPIARLGFTSGSLAGSLAALSFLAMCVIAVLPEELPLVPGVDDVFLVPLTVGTLVALVGIAAGLVGQLFRYVSG